MALTQPEQIQHLLEDKKSILITFRKDATNDTIAAAVALSLFLERLGKQVDMVSDGFTPPKSLTFLKKADAITPAFSHLQRFIVTIDIEETGVEELSYDLKDKKLRIFITPKHGFLSRDQVRTAQTDFKYQVIFVLDTPDLESLGGLYDNNTDLFYKVPMVNVGHDPASEHFGQINLIDLTATSTAEILLPLMRHLGETQIDHAVATALLTSIIAKTRSFKTENVKPHTLGAASTLMSLGANREEIVHHLYRTRSISTLKLWGHALTHMQSDKALGLVWSSITRDDFVRSGASEEDLRDIVDELISNSPEAKVTLFFHEHPKNGDRDSIHVIIHAEKGYDAKKLSAAFGGKGNERYASFGIDGTSLAAALEDVVGQIRRILTEQK